MTTPTPKTRRQLREALEEEKRAHESTRWLLDVQESASDCATEKAVTTARRETLEKVIDALGLTEYSQKLTLEALLSDRYAGGHIGPKPGHERFWADINTTLEHREAEKHAETVRKTAERVAGLTKKESLADKVALFAGETLAANTVAAPKMTPTKPAKKESK